MKTKFRWIFTLLLAFMVQISFAQEKTVSGNVSDNNGEPMLGATVIIEGTTTGVSTDLDGNYSINVKIGDVLTFSYVGYTKQSITVGTSNTINVVLVPDNALEEVVVVAYGTTSLEAFTGSASVIGSEKLAIRNVTYPVAAL